MIFCLKGKVKPYVRMTQRSKHVDPQAREYLASKLALGLQLKEAMRDKEMIGRGIPLVARITFEMQGGVHRCDLDNQVKAVLDAAQGIVFADDRWVDLIDAARWKADENLTTLVVREKGAE